MARDKFAESRPSIRGRIGTEKKLQKDVEVLARAFLELSALVVPSGLRIDDEVAAIVGRHSASATTVAQPEIYTHTAEEWDHEPQDRRYEDEDENDDVEPIVERSLVERVTRLVTIYRRVAPEILKAELERIVSLEKLVEETYPEEVDLVDRAIWTSPPIAPSERLVSSIRIETIAGRDHVSIWSRGALSGELIVDKGDGEALSRALGVRAEKMGRTSL